MGSLPSRQGKHGYHPWELHSPCWTPGSREISSWRPCRTCCTSPLQPNPSLQSPARTSNPPLLPPAPRGAAWAGLQLFPTPAGENTPACPTSVPPPSRIRDPAALLTCLSAGTQVKTFQTPNSSKLYSEARATRSVYGLTLVLIPVLILLRQIPSPSEIAHYIIKL